MPNSKIKYNNYNLFSIDFEKIEKILEDTFIRNACILKTDEIAEMKYTDEEFLNDGISELNKNIKKVDLDEKNKIAFVKFYENNLKDNFVSCFDVNEGFKNIIIYINKNTKKINNNKEIYSIITDGGFPYELCKNLKNFLEDNKNIMINKLTNLMIFLEKLYFEMAIKEIGGEYKVKLEEDTKKIIDKYYEEKSGQLITKDKLSITIMRFILNDLMNQRNEKTKNRSFEMKDNLFEILANKSLWEESTYKDNKFLVEIEEYKELRVLVENSFDFYMYISTKSIKDFEEEIKGIVVKIESEKKAKEIEIKKEERKILEEKIINSTTEEKKDVILNEGSDDEDIDDITDY